MKSFSYTAMDSSGGLRRGIVQAQDRENALKSVRSSGFITQHIQEVKKDTALNFNLKLLIAICCSGILLTVGILYIYHQHRKLIHNVDVVQKTKVIDKKMRYELVTAIPKESKVPKKAAAILPIKEQTNSVEVPKVVDAPPPSQVLQKTNRVMQISLSSTRSDETGEPVHEEAAFKTDFEIALASIVATPLGVEPIPLIPPEPTEEDLNAQESDVFKTLENTIVIKPSDSDSLVKTKEDVAWAKVGLKTALQQGISANEYVETLFEQTYNNAKERQAIIEALEEIKQKGDEGETFAALKEVNEYLSNNNRPIINTNEVFEEYP